MADPSYASGHAIISSVDGTSGRMETYTLTCVHCDWTWHFKLGSGVKRGFCQNCMGPTCGKTACQLCVPFMKKLEAQERRARFLEALQIG